MFAARVNTGKRALLEQRGFKPVHTVLRLKIDLSRRSVEEPDPPEGIVLRPYGAADTEAVRATMLEAYEGHHRYTTRRFDEWLDLRLRHPAFDPTLWRVAECDGEVVGAVLVYDVGGTGYLNSSVGVKEAFRGRGVAPALLRDALGALRDRGQMRVLVSLDAAVAGVSGVTVLPVATTRKRRRSGRDEARLEQTRRRTRRTGQATSGTGSGQDPDRRAQH